MESAKPRIITHFSPPAGAEAAQPLPELEPEEIAETTRALKTMEEMPGSGIVMNAVPDRTVSLMQTFIAREAAEGRLPLLPAPGNTLEAKFDSHDPRWWEFWKYAGKLRRYPWIESLVSPTSIRDHVRVALFGDWATGLYGAPLIAEKIKKAQPAYDIVFHLGDTYYSGADDEIAQWLMDAWPKVPNAINRTLNGNHEMYSGGNAYFQRAVKAFGQSASYFALQNSHWLLAGLDTSYSEHDLHGGQADWLEKLVDDAAGRKVVLFSHHQPFSLFDDGNPKVVKRLSNLLRNRRITAWYWGHEHRCSLYEPHEVWGFRGRCVGHGGFPEFRNTKLFPAKPPASPEPRKFFGRNFVPGAWVIDGPNACIPGHENEYGPHGYMTLEFDGAELFEVVHDATSDKELWARPIVED